jgi:hypothetical protein
LAGCSKCWNAHAEPWIVIHDKIKPSRVKFTKSKILGTVKELITDRKSGSSLQTPASNPSAHEQLDDFAIDPNQPKVSIAMNRT